MSKWANQKTGFTILCKLFTRAVSRMSTVLARAGSSPGHESANLGPSALRDEEADHRIRHCTPGFTDEQHHGRLEGVDLGSRTGLRTRKMKVYTHSDRLCRHLPERHRAGRFAGRRPWHWRRPPWALRRWRNTAYCLMSASGSGRSARTRERETLN